MLCLSNYYAIQIFNVLERNNSMVSIANCISRKVDESTVFNYKLLFEPSSSIHLKHLKKCVCSHSDENYI